jgi:hypothetical protein
MKKDISDFIVKMSEFQASAPYKFLGLTIIIFIIGALLFRIRVPLLGDGFFLVKNIAEALHNTAPLYYRNEPLSTFYFFNMMSAFGVSTFKEFLQTFLIADIILGIGFIITVFFITHNLFADKQDKLLAFIFLLVIPYIQLFFGYVETYAFVLFLAAIYMLTAILCLKKKLPFTYAATAFFAMSLSHYLSLALLPSLLYIAYLDYRFRGIKGILIGFSTMAVIFIGLLAVFNFEIDKFSASVPHSHFIPVLSPDNPAEKYSTAYTLFSGYHIADLFNFTILMCPFSIFLLILSWKNNIVILTKSVEYKFFIVAIIPLIVLLCTIKFDLGAAKDWDIFTPFVFVLTLFCIFTFLYKRTVATIKIISLVIILTFINTLSYVWLNSTTDSSIRRYLSLLDKRTIGNFGYYGATLHLALYYHQINNKPLAVELWEKYIDVFPSDPRGYRNTITNLQYLGNDGFNHVEHTYEKWIKANPQDSNAVFESSQFCIEAGNYLATNNLDQQAKYYFEKAIILYPKSERAYNYLGVTYLKEGNNGKALELFQKSIELNSSYSDPYYNLGGIYEKQKNIIKATEYYRQAAQLGNVSANNKFRQLNNNRH